MNHLSLKQLLPLLAITVLFTGCASTADPHKTQSQKDFVYDPDSSYAMNVMKGSLDDDEGLKDTDIPKNNFKVASDMDYIGGAILGSSMGGGFSGGLLGVLGAGYSPDKRFKHHIGVVYYPVDHKLSTPQEVQLVFDALEQEIIATAEKHRKLVFLDKSTNKQGKTLLSFKGDDCIQKAKNWANNGTEVCNFIHYQPPQLIKYTTTNPDGEKGLFAVVNYDGFFLSTYLGLDLDRKFYVYAPSFGTRNRFPFVMHNQKAYLFINPNSTDTPAEKTALTPEDLVAIDPWVKQHLGFVLERNSAPL